MMFINTKHFHQYQGEPHQAPKGSATNYRPCPHPSINPFRSSRGFTLIETLISLTLFAFGALSLITLQIKSIQMTHHAHLNATAMSLLEDMSGRISSNLSAAKAGHYQLTQINQTPTHCPPSKCTTLQMAQYDKKSWLEQVKKHLPNAHASIQFINDQYTLSLYWASQSLYRACPQASANTKKLNCLSLKVHL